MMFAGCRAAPAHRDTHDADVRTIKEGEMLWVRHWSTRDVDQILSHYAEDAIWMGPHLPFANGREAIREVVQRLVEDGNFSITFEPARVDTAKSGELGFSQGRYTMTLTDPFTKRAVTDQGSYARIYRREPGGGWRTIQEINTSSPTDVRTPSEPRP